MKSEDSYGDIRYRSLISWSARLDREWPFLCSELEAAPERSVVDLGCGPGEHLARLSAGGWRATGIDSSPGQIEDARAHHPGVEFVLGSMEELADLTPQRFGAALCLGNVLPSLSDGQMNRTLGALSTRLIPGGIFVAQLIDYEPILAGRKRALPVTVRRDDEGGEVVFLRVYAPDPEPRHVQFLPTTLRVLPHGEPALEVRSSPRIRHRGWTADELEPLLATHGFREIRRFGGLDGSTFASGRSQDLVLVATRG